MYQFSTFIPLAGSKTYFKTIPECKKQLARCVKMTNAWRKKQEKPYLSVDEIVIGCRLLKLDMDKPDPQEYLGKCKDLSVDNLIKKPEGQE